MLPEGLAAMLTLTGKAAVRCIVSELDIAGLFVAHDSDEVIKQLIPSLSVRLLLTYVELLLPTLVPFNFH